jgi:hypothetical protein
VAACSVVNAVPGFEALSPSFTDNAFLRLFQTMGGENTAPY